MGQFEQISPKEIAWLIAGCLPAAVDSAHRYINNRLSKLVWASGGSFCVTLRSEPSHLSVATHPVVNISLADEAADDPDFGARNSCLNLPIGFSDPLWLEYDAGRFAHPGNMAPNRADS